MRLFVSNTKEQIIFLLYEFLLSTLNQKEVKLIHNGNPYDGVINNILLDEEDYSFITFKINEDTSIRFPFTEDSKVRLDKGLFYFETKSNTVLIYV